MENKPKFIIYDGLDRGGKSSTLQLVWKARDKIDTCIDRGILSNIVYNAIFDRNVDLSEYIKYLPDVEGVIYLYFFASAESLKQRAIATNDDMYSITEIKEQKEVFDNAFELLKSKYKHVKFIKINTSLFNQKEIVKKILEELK